MIHVHVHVKHVNVPTCMYQVYEIVDPLHSLPRGDDARNVLGCGCRYKVVSVAYQSPTRDGEHGVAETTERRRLCPRVKVTPGDLE